MITNGQWTWALLLAGGCVGTAVQYVQLNSPSSAHRARPHESVDVYSTGRTDRPYVDVGLLYVRQRGQWGTRDAEGLIAAMRKEAGLRGCDALIIQGPRDVLESVPLRPAHVYARKAYSGSCVVYTGPERSPTETGASSDGRSHASASTSAETSRRR